MRVRVCVCACVCMCVYACVCECVCVFVHTGARMCVREKSVFTLKTREPENQIN